MDEELTVSFWLNIGAKPQQDRGGALDHPLLQDPAGFDNKRARQRVTSDPNWQGIR